MSTSLRRRWFQFGLGTLLFLVAVMAIVVRFSADPTPSVLDKRHDVELVGIPLSMALTWIHQCFDLPWRFDEAAFAAAGVPMPKDLVIDRIVHRDATLREILDQLLRSHGLDFRISQGQLIVFPRPKP